MFISSICTLNIIGRWKPRVSVHTDLKSVSLMTRTKCIHMHKHCAFHHHTRFRICTAALMHIRLPFSTYKAVHTSKAPLSSVTNIFTFEAISMFTCCCHIWCMRDASKFGIWCAQRRPGRLHIQPSYRPGLYSLLM